MSDIKLDCSGIDQFVSVDEMNLIQGKASEAYQKITKENCEGSEMLGFVGLPTDYDKDEFTRIQATAEKIRENSDVLIVIGIGGSYLGARAVIEALKPNLYNNLDKEARDCPEIYFAGQNMSGSYLSDLLEVIKDKDISINVISKSGTTTEPAIAFRIFKKLLEVKYGKSGAKERIFATTDSEVGALKSLADKEGYETFVVPNNIGGRFSVLTAVGLLPIAVAGIDIEALLAGAKIGQDAYAEDGLDNNVNKYAVARNILYQKGKKIEIFANYEPKLHYFSEWLKQLFGESEGKNGKGIFPVAVDFSTDLHSLGQYIQEGERTIFETVLFVEKSAEDIMIPESADDTDGFNFIAGKTLSSVNETAMTATVAAHVGGGVPNIVINISELTPFCLGQLIYFFEKSCAMSAYILGVNPFNQPGVEVYKKNMFKLLGKTEPSVR
jgi:glucose-6-phosphate isomerase